MVLRMMMLRSVEEEDRSQDQDRDPHFVQACALDLHFNIAQELNHAEKIQAKCRGPTPGTTLCANLVDILRASS
jgi:hypothetical protein